MTCPAEQLLQDYAAGLLGDSAARPIRQHLRACARCRNLLEGLEGTIDDVTIAEAWACAETVAETTPPVEPAAELGVLAGRPIELDISFLKPSPNPDALGRIGGYDILSVVGQGGMGVVLKAHDESLGRAVAIKVLATRLAANERARKRFIREARAAAAITDPNVITIYHVGEQEGMPYLVMEYIAGPSLRERIKAQPKLTPAEVLEIASQVASGLAAAHAKGVIHRDIKPDNILLERGIERVKIGDFGLARVALDISELSSLDQIIGTPAFMSPEQVNGDPVDSRSDLFSLGCVMYAMVAGHSPFRGATTVVVVRKVCDHHPKPLHELDPSVPRALSDVVAKLLAKRPDDRYPSAEQLAVVLKRHVAEARLAGSDERAIAVAPPAPPRPPKRPRRRLAALAAAVAVLALVWLVWGLARGRDRRVTDPPRTEITVARTGGAECRGLAEALARAGPGSVIRVLDDATYEGPLRIDDPKRWRGLTIESAHGATLVATKHGDVVVMIQNTPGVTLRGLTIPTVKDQHAIVIAGETAGVWIENMRCLSPPDSNWASIWIHQSAHGSATAPIGLRRSTIEAGAMGIVVQGERGDPIRFVEIAENHCSSQDIDILLLREVEDIDIRCNICTGKDGVYLDLNQTEGARRVHIVNNSFFQMQRWLTFGSPASNDHEEIEVANNLILGAGEDVSHYAPLAAAAGAWSFHHNWWEPDSWDEAQPARAVAELKRQIVVRSRDPAHPDFLRPPSGSPLGQAGAGGPLPSYIGALPPDDRAQLRPSPTH
jgi:predicted Ser/Thr protein kinase